MPQGIPGGQFIFHFFPMHPVFATSLCLVIDPDGTAAEHAAVSAALIYDQAALDGGKGHGLIGHDRNRHRQTTVGMQARGNIHGQDAAVRFPAPLVDRIDKSLITFIQRTV